MKVIAVNGKLLLANGKAVKPPAVAAGSELVLSATRLSAVTICTDVIANHIVSSSWSPDCIVEDTTQPPPPKYSYNGVVLPEIPADVLASFPYCWISSQSGLIVAAYPWYYASGKMNIAISAENRKYLLSSDGAMWYLSDTYTDTGGYTVNALPIWSNHDIPNGSATATEIYFEGSEPVLVE